jgi:hypothetical protein
MARPLDLFTACGPEDRPHVFCLNVHRSWGHYTVLAIFNDGERDRVRELSAESLGLRSNVPCRIFDFWRQSYGGTHQGIFRFTVPGQMAGLYRIEEARSHPWLLSTDMHVLQGRVEIPELRWDARRGILSGIATRPHGEEGNLLLFAPPGWKPKRYDDLWVLQPASRDGVVIRKHLAFSSASIDWSLAFERC